MDDDLHKNLINEILTPDDIAYLESLGVVVDGELLDPKIDLVFKAMLTTDSEASRTALKDILSCALLRRISMVRVANNELASTGLMQKQANFDLHAVFDDDDEAEIEMQMRLRDNVVNRSEFNTSKLYSSQEIKGKLFDDLKKVYMIMILNSTLFHDRKEFIDYYTFRNAEGRVLSGNMNIIFIELSKLGEVEKKPVSEMSGIERWALF